METKQTTKNAEVVDDALDELMNPKVKAKQELERAAQEGRPFDEMAFVEARARILEKLTTFAVQATDASHWESFADKPRLNDGGACIVARQLGIHWFGPDGKDNLDVILEHEEDEIGRFFTYRIEGFFQLGYSKIDKIPAVGTCSSRDDFLGTGLPTEAKPEGVRASYEVDKHDILKKALANFRVNGVSQLTGLKGMSWERLKRMNPAIDPAKVGKVNFRGGSKGGGRGGEWAIPFGENKGKPVTDPTVTDKDLGYFLGRCRSDLADAAKAKYHANATLGVQTIEAEQARRKGAPAAGPAPAGHAPSTPTAQRSAPAPRQAPPVSGDFDAEPPDGWHGDDR